MKKSIYVAVAIVTIGTLVAFADEKPKGEKGMGFEHFCPGLKLTEDQKTKMKEARFNFRDQKIDLKAALEKSRLKYERLVSDPHTDAKAAKAASDEIAQNLSRLISAKQDFKNSVAFEILKPEQREPAMKCEKRHKHHGWFHRWHGDGEGHDHEGA